MSKKQIKVYDNDWKKDRSIEALETEIRILESNINLNKIQILGLESTINWQNGRIEFIKKLIKTEGGKFYSTEEARVLADKGFKLEEKDISKFYLAKHRTKVDYHSMSIGNYVGCTEPEKRKWFIVGKQPMDFQEACKTCLKHNISFVSENGEIKIQNQDGKVQILLKVDDDSWITIETFDISVLDNHYLVDLEIK